MTTIIYKFEQGRLLVHEERKVESRYVGSGVPVRIGGIRAIEQVLSIDTSHSQYGLITPLNEVRTSGDEIFVVMRRGDLNVSGCCLSGMFAASGYVSGITSGLAWLGELTAASGEISGVVTVIANVIGF